MHQHKFIEVNNKHMKFMAQNQPSSLFSVKSTAWHRLMILLIELYTKIM